MDNETLDNDEISSSDNMENNNKNKDNKNIHKRNWLRSVLKEGKWYLAASMATKALGFFLIPIFTQYLSPSEYGVLGIITTITELLPILLSLSIDVAFVRFYHDYKKDDEQLAALYSSVFWFVIVFGGAMLTLFIFSTYFWFEELLEVLLSNMVLLSNGTFL